MQSRISLLEHSFPKRLRCQGGSDPGNKLVVYITPEELSMQWWMMLLESHLTWPLLIGSILIVGAFFVVARKSFFDNWFQQFFLIFSLFNVYSCFLPLPSTSSSTKIRGGLLVPSFPKTGSYSVVPYDIFTLFSCSPNPLGDPQLFFRKKAVTSLDDVACNANTQIWSN